MLKGFVRIGGVATEIWRWEDVSLDGRLSGEVQEMPTLSSDYVSMQDSNDIKPWRRSPLDGPDRRLACKFLENDRLFELRFKFFKFRQADDVIDALGPEELLCTTCCYQLCDPFGPGGGLL